MHPATDPPLHQTLLGRCRAIADGWFDALPQGSTAPASATELCQQLVQLTEEAVNEERHRIAREIHDDLTQRLASLLMKVDLCLELIDEEPGEARRELDAMGCALQDAIQEARRSVLALRPLALEQLGFHEALSNHIRDFERQTGISVDASLLREQCRLPGDVEYTLFRTVQEALSNVLWHARADRVWIDLECRSPDRVHLVIRDEGAGVHDRPPRRVARGSRGLGLLHMQERVRAMGGSFRMETQPSAGTRVEVTLPLNG